MSLFSEPKNGDFASCVEELSRRSLEEIQKNAAKSRAEHDRHATGADLNKAESALSKSDLPDSFSPSEDSDVRKKGGAQEGYVWNKRDISADEDSDDSQYETDEDETSDETYGYDDSEDDDSSFLDDDDESDFLDDEDDDDEDEDDDDFYDDSDIIGRDSVSSEQDIFVKKSRDTAASEIRIPASEENGPKAEKYEYSKNAPLSVRIFFNISMFLTVFYAVIIMTVEFECYAEFVPLSILLGYMLFTKQTVLTRFFMMTAVAVLFVINTAMIAAELYEELSDMSYSIAVISVILWIALLKKKKAK